MKNNNRFIGIIIILILIYSLIEPYCVSVKEYQINSADVPKAFDGTKIAFLSDIHYGKLYKINRVYKIIDKTNELNPDIVLLGGDYISDNKNDLEAVFKAMCSLRSKYGSFSVIGNHEWPYEREYVKNAVKNKITPVDKKPVRIFSGLESIVIGGSEFYLNKKPDLKLIDNMAQKEDYVIYLQHNADLAEVLNNPKIDIMLSGHNHGGQFTLFGLYAPYLPSKYGQKYRSGLIKNKAYPVLVSNGIGNYMVPMRFFARPQIVIITLHSNKS